MCPIMKKYELKCFYTISKFKRHAELKKELLESINLAEAEHVLAPGAEVDISRGDWYNSTDTERSWVQFIKDPLLDHMSQTYHQVGYDMFQLRQLWFQQYNHESGHGWHTHGSNFTNVYYVDLPKDSPRTQMVLPWDQTTVVEFEVEEGDVLTFPSFVIHRGPPNIGIEQKTIISFNIDIDYPDSQYGKGLTL